MTLESHKWAKIPLAHIATYLNDCLAISPHIISVGCGNGAYEYEISLDNEKLRSKMILVDPEPEQFGKYPKTGRHLAVTHTTVASLVAQKPDVVDNCVLLLIWPPPTLPENRLEPSYDYEAVMALKPKSIIIVYEKPPDMEWGAAGRFEMCRILKSPEEFGYRHISTTEYRFTTRIGALYPKISWLAKRGSLVPKNKNCYSLQKEADTISQFTVADDPGACSVS